MGSQSPLPYRLAMAHRARYYTIFFVFPQGEGSTFPLLRRLYAAFCSLQFVKTNFFIITTKYAHFVALLLHYMW